MLMDKGNERKRTFLLITIPILILLFTVLQILKVMEAMTGWGSAIILICLQTAV